MSGSGKTSLAKHISKRLGIPYVEIDSLFHGPDWQPRHEFPEDVDRIAQHADTMLWLDLPTSRTLYQLTRRTISRRIQQVELWNGNYEGPLRNVFTDPDHTVRWGIRTRKKCRERVPAIYTSHPHLRVVRLTSRRDSEQGGQARGGRLRKALIAQRIRERTYRLAIRADLLGQDVGMAGVPGNFGDHAQIDEP